MIITMQQEDIRGTIQMKKHLSDEAKLIKAAQKNPSQFEPLYNEYYESIFRYVYQRVNDKQNAFDITSTVFLKALNNIKKYKIQGFPFSSWLYRIAHNELIDAFKNQKAKRTVNIDDTQLQEINEEIEGGNSSSEKNIKLILKYVNDLAEGDLQIIEMKYFEYRSFKEIGEILNLTESNARVKCHRIIQKIKRKVNP